VRKRRGRLGERANDSAAPENASWRSVFGLRDGAKAAIKADDQGGKSLLRGMRDE